MDYFHLEALLLGMPYLMSAMCLPFSLNQNAVKSILHNQLMPEAVLEKYSLEAEGQQCGRPPVYNLDRSAYLDHLEDLDLPLLQLQPYRAKCLQAVVKI